MDEALLLAVVALAIVATSGQAPESKQIPTPTPPRAPAEKTWQDYLGGCVSTGFAGASIGIVAGPKGAAIGGAVGCLLGIGTTAASDSRFA
jgi:hypothetical protein